MRQKSGGYYIMIRIIADSTCDLSKEIVKQYNIKVISTKVIINGEKLNDYDYDGESLDKLYANFDDIKEPPSYEPPTSEEYVFAIEESLFNGVTDFIIFIPSSQQIDDFPGVVNAAVTSFIEKNRVPGVRIRVINTLNVSQGFGYSVLKAAKMVKAGATFEKIIEYCEENKTKVKDFLSVPDVDFLYKTGNVTRTGAKASKMLGITPVLKLGTTGKATLASKVVGENKIAQCFANEFKHNADMGEDNFVIIGYSSEKNKAVEIKDAIISETGYDGDIYIMQMRPAFGAHMGARAAAIYFMGKQKSVALFNIFRFK